MRAIGRAAAALVLGGLWLLPAASAAARDVAGRIDVPPRVQAAEVEVRVVHAPTLVEDETSPPVASSRVRGNGTFVLSMREAATTDLQLEFLGDGVRAARFPLADALNVAAGETPRFSLNPGVTQRVRVVRSSDRQPIAGAVIGPVQPDVDAPAGALELAYPLYAQTNAEGWADVRGLQPRVNYAATVRAPGYERRTLKLPAPDGASAEQTVTLSAGGSTVTLKLRGHRTDKPYPRLKAALRGPAGEFLLRRADGQGHVDFSGMPPGRYSASLEAPEFGGTLPTDVSVLQEAVSVKVPVPEGILVDGAVLDFDTNRPVAKALVRMGAYARLTDANGMFEFRDAVGQWPMRLGVEADNYEFDPSAREDAGEVAGFDLKDHRGLRLTVRRRRVMEISLRDTTLTSPARQATLDPPANVTILSTQADDGAQTAFTADTLLVQPLKSLAPRVVFARNVVGLASPAVAVLPTVDTTTATVHLDLQPAANLAGSLTYSDAPDTAPAFRVSVRAALTDAAGTTASVEIAAARGEANGRFRIATLPPGSVEVAFLRSGAEKSQPFAVRQVMLASGDTAQVDVTLAKGAVFAGRAVGPDGQPRQEIPLVLYGRTPDGAALRQQVMTRPDGSFRTEGWGAAIERLTVDHSEWRPVDLTNIALPATDYTLQLQPRAQISITLSAPENARRLAVAYLMRGSVRSDSLASQQEFYDAEQDAAFAGKETVTLRPRSAGKYRVAVSADDAWAVSAPIEWTATSDHATLKLVPGTANLTVRLRMSQQTALPDNAEVLLSNTALPEKAGRNSFAPSSRSADTLTFERIPPGVYLLAVTAPTGETASLPNVELVTNESKSVELALEASLQTVAGTVAAGDGSAVRGASVKLYREDLADGKVVGEATTDASGRFELTLVPSGYRYLVEARQGAATAQASVSVAAGTPPPAVALRLATRVQVTLKLGGAAAKSAGPLVLTKGAESVTVPLGENPNPTAELEPGTWQAKIPGHDAVPVKVEGEGAVDVVVP